MADQNSPPRGQWTTEIFGCFEDCSNLDEGRTTAYTAGQNYLVLLTLVPIVGANLYACTYRNKLRRHFELPEQPCGPCGDCCVHHLCCFCALCQEHRELKNRHMDPVGGKIVREFNIFLAATLHIGP
nr:cell number regulator 4 [Quercus suber]